RMPGAFQPQVSCCGKFRHGGVKIARKSRPRKNTVQFSDCLRRSQKRSADQLQLLGKLAKNSQYLRGFVFGKLDKLIVLLNGFEGLHENRLPRGACSVNDARNG